MTIREMEELSGMTRANIRFYESEGLLAPARGSNGYRDYSREDLETLKRIRLLRTLRVPLEQIRALHRGDESLMNVLDSQLGTLEREQQEVERAQRVCREMVSDQAEYRTLNAQRYLDSMARPQETARALAADVIPAVKSPWRRLFARGLDSMLYAVAWDVFLLLAFNINLSLRAGAGKLVDAAVILLMTLLLEPLFLSLLGTTPGKWILGLRVTDNDDAKLSYRAAMKRTWGVLLYGEGLSIPVFNLIRHWKSYHTCMEGGTLEWEYDSTLHLHDERKWRAFALACAHAALAAVLLLAIVRAETPMYRGDITTAQFSRNFNRLAAYYQVDFDATLDENAQWVEKQSRGHTIYVGGEPVLPTFEIEETNGVVTAVRFRCETVDHTWPPSCEDQMVLAALAFAGAREPFTPFSQERERMLETIQFNSFADFSFTAGGIHFACDVEYEGYEALGGEYLWAKEGEEQSYSLDFGMSITK
ncbi:MAG: MerR family transcriptional regulator [Clostridia bacterium]|nr:MerR family transcriptional regulator [Clostridia bacterium]